MKLKKIAAMASLLVFLAGGLVPEQAMAITVKQEEGMAHEFMRVVLQHYELIRDPTIVDYVNQVGQKIVAGLPSKPFKYHFYVIREATYNAFASPAGNIFVNSGLLAALDNESELAGILAHEIAHAQCRHISQRIERSSKMNLLALAGMAAGILLGVGGSATAASAVTVGTMATEKSLALAYSREDEMQADQLGLGYLTAAGYNGTGLLTALKKIRSKQWFGSAQIPTYLKTHPASEDRIAYIDTWLQSHPQAGAPREGGVTDSDYPFARANMRLVALYGDPKAALPRFTSAVDRNPEDPIARYGFGLILARTGNRPKAIGQLKKALARNPFDPYLLADLGRIYFLDGRYKDARASLEGALGIRADHPEALFYLGRTDLETGNAHRARQSLETVVKIDPDYVQAYYFLGQACDRQGRSGDAHYYLGSFYTRSGSYKNAVFHLTRALQLTDAPDKRQELKKMLEKARQGQVKAAREARRKKP